MKYTILQDTDIKSILTKEQYEKNCYEIDTNQRTFNKNKQKFVKNDTKCIKNRKGGTK